MTVGEARAVNILLRTIFVIDLPLRGTEAPLLEETRQAAAHLAEKAYKTLSAGVHPADIQRAKRRNYQREL